MTQYLKNKWNKIQATYWFLPGLFAILSLVLAIVTVTLDQTISLTWLENIPVLYVSSTESAQGLLTTIAGSVIGIAGVAFSITVAAVSFTASQYGPRILVDFMRDRGNQLTMAVFISTFLYCLFVLQSVRTDASLAGEFVPHLSVFIASLFGLASVFFLIFFIHHVPASLRVSAIIANIGKDLKRKTVTTLESDGKGVEHLREIDDQDIPEAEHEDSYNVRFTSDGYVQNIDYKKLFKLATEWDVTINLFAAPGQFKSADMTFAVIAPANRLPDKFEVKIENAFITGSQRLKVQDLLFLIDELVEIAARALSPGINDPYTAINCMDWLGSFLVVLYERRLPAKYTFDDDGNLRLIQHSLSYDFFTDYVFDHLRPYVSDDPNAALHMMKLISNVGETTKDPARRERLELHADALREEAMTNNFFKRDIEILNNEYVRTIRTLRSGTIQDDDGEDESEK